MGPILPEFGKSEAGFGLLVTFWYGFRPESSKSELWGPLFWHFCVFFASWEGVKRVSGQRDGNLNSHLRGLWL